MHNQHGGAILIKPLKTYIHNQLINIFPEEESRALPLYLYDFEGVDGGLKGCLGCAVQLKGIWQLLKAGVDEGVEGVGIDDIDE